MAGEWEALWERSEVAVRSETRASTRTLEVAARTPGVEKKLARAMAEALHVPRMAQEISSSDVVVPLPRCIGHAWPSAPCMGH